MDGREIVQVSLERGPGTNTSKHVESKSTDTDADGRNRRDPMEI